MSKPKRRVSLPPRCPMIPIVEGQPELASCWLPGPSFFALVPRPRDEDARRIVAQWLEQLDRAIRFPRLRAVPE